MSKTRENLDGAQTAQRALRVLKLVAAHNAQGITARQIVESLSEDRSAIQRSLSALVAEGLIHRGVDLHRYHLGVEAAHIGRATLQHSPLIEQYQFELQKIAWQTGDTVFLSVRIGDFVLCIFRDEGSAPVRVARTRVGDVRVLGTSAGGLALLATLDDGEVRRIYERHPAAFGQARIDLSVLWRHVAMARRAGYALLSDNVSEGVTSIGICLGRPGQPVAAAAIASAKTRMTPDRMQALHTLLRQLSEHVDTGPSVTRPPRVSGNAAAPRSPAAPTR